MRFNSAELKQFAITSSCDKEGVLSLREKEGKLWNKTDVLTERWCKLVGNLLFYMKGKSKSSEPFGVFVLEKFNVSNSVDEPSFVVEFHSDRSTYFLATNQTEAREWSEALQKASYSYLKNKYYGLQRSVQQLREKEQVSA